MGRPNLVVWLSLLLTVGPVSSDYGTTEWLRPGSVIAFDARVVPHHNLLNRLYWTEKNERSTSKDYDLWEKADLYLLEWPGNVTIFDAENPVVKWGRARAKYIEDRCGSDHTGIEMRAYAYEYVYLTYGANRLTKTYTVPLTVPKSILPYKTLTKLSPKNSHEPNKLNTIVATDIAFVFDALLIAYSCGVIRVSGLEMGWAELASVPRRPLKYEASKGISGEIDRLEVQHCCLKTGYCPFGNMVVAYKKYSYPHVIYTSHDGGVTFNKVSPLSFTTGALLVVLSYPEIRSLLIVHGNENEVKLNQMITSPGFTYSEERPLLALRTTGVFQGARLGMEMSFVLWDSCNVWYSPNVGSNATKSLFYVNGNIKKDGHRILTKHCAFGRKSALSYSMKGKFGLLDSNNAFFLGVDTKSNLSQLVAIKMDMSLLRDGTELSAHPYFDLVEQPKVLYPPKFLQLPERLNMGRSYERRLGMRLLPKNVYPSDSILSFYEEYARMSEPNKMFALKHCETSTLSLNGSISQRNKFYSIKNTGQLHFIVSFTSRSNASGQLKFEPRRVISYISVVVRQMSVDKVENETVSRYSIKYSVMIKPITASAIDKVFRITFYTKNALRCHSQPRVPVHVKVEKISSHQLTDLTDDDMSKQVYLKSVHKDGDATYLDKEGTVGEVFNVNTCPLANQMGGVNQHSPNF